MNKFYSVILALLFVVILVTSSFAGGKACFLNGETLAKYYSSYCVIYNEDGSLKEGVKIDLKIIAESMKYMGYISAVNDAFPPTSRIFCMKEGEPLAVVATVVGAFLIEHPEKWENDAAYIVAEALSKKYICKAIEESVPDFGKNKKKFFF